MKRTHVSSAQDLLGNETNPSADVAEPFAGEAHEVEIVEAVVAEGDKSRDPPPDLSSHKTTFQIKWSFK